MDNKRAPRVKVTPAVQPRSTAMRVFFMYLAEWLLELDETLQGPRTLHHLLYCRVSTESMQAIVDNKRVPRVKVTPAVQPRSTAMRVFFFMYLA